MLEQHLYQNKEMTLLDLLDGIIDTGVVVSGEVVISVADIDLICIDLKLLISTFEKAFFKGKGFSGDAGGEFFLYESEDSAGTEQCRAGISEIGPNHY